MVRRLSLSFVFEKKKRSPRFLNFFPPPTTTKNARDLRPRAREEYREEYSITKRDAALCDEEGMICILRVFSKAFLLREVFFYARVCVFARKILKIFVQRRGASSLSARAFSAFRKNERYRAAKSSRRKKWTRSRARDKTRLNSLSLSLFARSRCRLSETRFFFFFCAFEYFPRREWCVRVTKCVVGGVKRFSTARKAASRG